MAIKTGPTDADDNTYLCDTDGKLQWHAQITYTAADATARSTTPAVMAAQATDYVSYSSTVFKTLLTENINAEVRRLPPPFSFVQRLVDRTPVSRISFIARPLNRTWSTRTGGCPGFP